MEKEISSGTMLGIVLIALAAVIGLGFGVFSIAKGVANEGTVGVQDNLAAVSESSYDDYNDKIVTGTMVRSAVQNFTGKSVAILINITAMDKGVKPYVSHEAIRVIGMTGNAFKTFEVVKGTDASLFDNDDGGSYTLTENGKVKTGSHLYVNYNALLGDWTADDDGAITHSLTGSIALKDGIFNAAEIPFAVNPQDGKVAFDYSVGGFARTGNCEYLAPTAKFDANLIKDETGTTIGIVFTQRAQ